MAWDPKRLAMVREAVAEGMERGGGRWWPSLGPLNHIERLVARRVVADRITYELATPGPREWERRLSPFNHAQGGR